MNLFFCLKKEMDEFILLNDEEMDEQSAQTKAPQ
jgi:hypothetical protein